MEIKVLQCPTCGNTFRLDLRGNQFECPYCGTKSIVSLDMIHNPFNDGYEEERGRIKARQEEINKNNPINTGISNTTKTNHTTTNTGCASIVGVVIAFIVIINIIGMVIGIFNDSTKKTSKPKGTQSTTIYDNGEVADYNDNSITATNNAPEEVAESTQFIPNSVSLLNLTAYTGNPFYEADYPMEDVFSTSYASSLYSRNEEENGTCYATYRLNSEYKTLEFWSGNLSYGMGAPGKSKIYVYGDNILLYSRELTCDSNTEFVQLDVSNVTDLTIEMYGYSELEISLAGSTSLWPAMFEPTLYT